MAHLVCFRIGKETFGVDIFDVREIVKAQEITTVPGTTDYVLGIINLRGKIISVMDLAGRLGLGTVSVDRTSRILVADLDGFTVGFLVDAATEVLKLPDQSIDSATRGAQEHHSRPLPRGCRQARRPPRHHPQLAPPPYRRGR